ncbi:TIGR03084 family protein [Sphingorhabdus lutea]|uniref:TIGR03084 family protein n=1 Tax=Sphingorhabdus lutea TaxID=1913578 RepID=A0A1L3J9K4_9SPHN|nr:TIGR03084 family metal-binding protein [Sphingorhabdus lutea]APG61809.1 TIGR03084 family protein [Sphingorhabdus lutea]
MQQAQDFFIENEKISTLIRGLDDAALSMPTKFKNWTIIEIIRHLHMWNVAAHYSLIDEAVFDSFFDDLSDFLSKGELREFEKIFVDGQNGQSMVAIWQDFYPRLFGAFTQIDPKKRVKWAGPSMSAKSSITARLMETWAHGQAIFDILGVLRPERDSTLRNITILGINSLGFNHKIRKLHAPEILPRLTLTAPSGEIWEFGEDENNSIKGSAVGFCQTITQCRNVADTDIIATGPIAQNWMAIAQCFAGRPHDPPKIGTRI